LSIFGRISTKMYKIEITKPAERDILDAAIYIMDQLLNPTAANRLLDEVEKAVQSLDIMPQRYAVVNDDSLARSGYRIMQVRNYLLFYIIRDEINTVVIHRFLYNRRDWLTILKS